MAKLTQPEAAPGLASKSELRVKGMTCGNCARHVTEALSGVAGVASVNVVLDRGRASVRWLADAAADPAKLIEAVRAAGFEASPISATAARDAGDDPRASWSPLEGWRFNVVVGSAVTLPLIAGEWLLQVGMEPWFRWLSFALATAVQVICGARFYRGAWTQLKGARASMDTLVALGSTTAFSYSVVAMLAGWPGHLYFMEAAAIITIISVGHWLEARATARAADALQSLLQLAPDTARRLEMNGRETEVPVDRLRVGDRVVLKPGDRVPVDGVVAAGESALNEAMLTGESLPVDKAPGAPLYAGTLNLDGRLVMRVTGIGESTALARVVAAVQRAQNSRANIQRLADQVSNIFVPVVLGIALATALWWGLAFESAKAANGWLSGWLWPVHVPPSALAAAVIHAAAVLIIACPCAMGLATPAAIMVGTNVAARRGILIRDGVALEKAGTISAVVFDKTGTLTQGQPAVAEFTEYSADEGPRLDAARLAAALTRHSSHPLSRAVAKLHAGDLEVADWHEIRGSGVEGRVRVDGGTVGSEIVRVGSLAWLELLGVDMAAGRMFIEDWQEQGATVLGVAVAQRLAGLMAVQDTLKPGAAAVVAQLAQHGHAIYLVTGDHPKTAAAIAKLVGIDAGNVFAGVAPGGKPEIVRQIQSKGRKVAFVGDGINDAPALEQADLGIAVCQASDVAREAADLVLLQSDIHTVPEALGLAQATLRTIRQNLFWAFFYNAAAVPLAALGFLSPVICAAAMGASDLIVIGNALRLRRWRMPRG